MFFFELRFENHTLGPYNHFQALISHFHPDSQKFVKFMFLQNLKRLYFSLPKPSVHTTVPKNHPQTI